MDPLAALQRCPVFAAVPRAALEELSRVSRVVRVARGEPLWRDGDAAEALAVIAGGSLKVTFSDPEDNEVVLHVWGPGDTAGEPALFSRRHSRRATRAEAIADSEVVLVPRAPLLALLARHPAALAAMLERLGDVIRQQTSMLTEAAFYDVGARVARRLLELAEAHGEPVAGGLRIRLPVSQRTLAGMAVASRENVNRALARFTAAGAIRREGDRLVVIDPAALRRHVRNPRWKARG